MKEWHELDYHERLHFLRACNGDKDILMQAILDPFSAIRREAVRLCRGDRDILLKSLQDPSRFVQDQVLKQCNDDKGLLDLVRGTPVHRTFEPPEKVYKRCRYGTIVVAEIPKDAFVRGKFGEKCRANKARIINIWSLNGKTANRGVSHYDGTVVYYAGDSIYISDFDYSDAECSTGFHFFCTLREAIFYLY